MPSEIPLTCKVPEAWFEEIDRYAQSQGLSRADVLKAAIAHLLDLKEPTDWPAQFAQLEQHLTKLSKQVTVLHKRLRSVEQQSLAASPPSPQLTASVPLPSLPTQAQTAAQHQPAPLSAASIDTVEGELLHHDSPPAPLSVVVTPPILSSQSQGGQSLPNQSVQKSPTLNPSLPRDSTPSSHAARSRRSAQKAPLGTLNLEELCRLNRMNPLTIQSKADAVGLTLAEAIELETGWKYDPRSKTYTPPI
ncbi:MAG: hypothetical protein F6J87_07105 [Spirulina sp. SIO3F2]|nr:hypothetical protein [Spirulina sp. SIO3F2]